MVIASAVGGTLNGVRIEVILHHFIYVNCSSFSVAVPLGIDDAERLIITELL